MNGTELITALGGISTATLHEAMDKQHTLWPSIRPLWRPLKLCGPAFTVRDRPGDNLTTHWALAVAPAGSVLVVTHEGDASCAGWGEIASVAAQTRGLLGLVTDGVVRDTEACQRLGFPIFCQGVSIKGTTKAYAGELDAPIACAGTLVYPGDYIVADEDGIVVVPRSEAEAVLHKAQARDQSEAQMIEQIRGGALTVDLLGLRGKLPKLQ